MEKSQETVEILELCIRCDEKAAQLYLSFSERSPNPEIKSFWHGMHLEELQHLRYWERLRELARQNAIPRLFQDSDRIRQELKSALDKADVLIGQLEPAAGIEQDFLAALRLEFYILHPVLENLFYFLNITPGEAVPEDMYGRHLNRFIEAMNRHGRSSPELGLIGEVLDRLWRQNQQLVHQSSTDPLTGVLNRRGFFQHMRPLAYLAMRNRANVCIMMVDIDSFKQLNDSHGHQAGDKMLSLAAQAIRSNLRRSDLAGRYGGDEFILYLSPMETGSVSRVAEKIRSRIAEDSHQVTPATASIGIAQGILAKDAEKEIAALIRKADRALYVSKEGGKNQITVHQG